MRRRSLAFELALIGAVPVVGAGVVGAALQWWFEAPLLAVGLAAAIMVPLWFGLLHRALAPIASLFRALAGTAASYRDGDFSFDLRWDRADELAELVEAHNRLGTTLREQRLGLVQRELLLDTMVQHTPVAMVLVQSQAGAHDAETARGRIVYANVAARRLLHGGRRLEGLALGTLLEAAPPSLREALERGRDGLFTSLHDDEEETFHLARRGFRLNGRNHHLLLIRRLTPELRRQEVRTWKKVIRVISHELNNSLAPVASMAHSGAELVRRGQYERLEQVFAHIEERARHLDGFIRGYARFAKLPSPTVETVSWSAYLAKLRVQIAFTYVEPPPEWTGRFDPAQLEQALLNLLKNAHESGSPADAVELRLHRIHGGIRIEVLDRGSGMPEDALANALVPFYSTKRTGTGLGLALAREIVEAHDGSIALTLRDGGGLTVSLTLPE